MGPEGRDFNPVQPLGQVFLIAHEQNVYFLKG